MNDFVDLSSGLSADYEKLYENRRYTDVSIQVGQEQSSKVFFAHALVLCTRSKFLENSLTENAESPDEIKMTVMTFEDVTPDVFETLLRYIYTGRMSYSSCKNIDWISLMDGAGKFELLDLLTAIETCLLDKQQEWVQQNILTVHKYAASTSSVNRLLDYCNQIMVSHPEIIFKSNAFATLPKETLITLLKSNDLRMEEDDDIWMSVIQWGAEQVPELKLGNDPNDWLSNDINTAKNIITDLLPRKLCCDILNYHMDKSYKPSRPTMPTERVSQSVTGEIPKAGKETIPIETIQRKVKERKEREEELKECERKQCEEERKKQEEAKSKATAEETDTKNQQEPKPNTTDLDREPSERKDTKHRPAKLDLSRTTSASVPSAPPNALGSARKIEDLNAVTYPPNITPPDPTLNQDAQPGKYKYDLPFLIQFMSFCKEKPDNLLHLDALRERVEVPKKKKKKQRTSESNKQGLSHNTSPAQSSYPPPPMGKFEKSITSEERFTQSSMQGRYSNSRIGPRTASKNPLLSDGWDTAGRKVDLTRFGQVRSTKISGTNMNLAPGSGTIARSASGSKDWRTNNKDREPVENKWQSSKSGGVVKSSSMSQEEAKRKIKAMVDEYWSVRDKKEVALCIKELPVGYFSDAIREFIESALEKKPDDVSSCADLLKELRKIYPADCKKAFTDIMDNLEDIGIDVPHAYAHTGQLLHGAQIKLNEVAELVRPLTYIGGSEPPSAKVVAAYLNSTKASMGEQMVLRQVKNARFDFASLFPDGNEDALNRFLEKQGLNILKKNVTDYMTSIIRRIQY